ncbi:MAG: CoA transferase [Dehalococcoidia bacterium]
MAHALKKPFEGLRVADFAWVGVGPLVSKYLADHGAEVIRIESNTYPEALRQGALHSSTTRRTSTARVTTRTSTVPSSAPP